MSLPLDGCNLVFRVDSIVKIVGMERFKQIIGPYLHLNSCCDGHMLKISSNNPGMEWDGLLKELRALGFRRGRDYIIGDFWGGRVPCTWAEPCPGGDEMRLRMKNVKAHDVQRGEFAGMG